MPKVPKWRQWENYMPEDFMKLPEPELQSIYASYRRSIGARKGSFTRHGVVSPALIAYSESARPWSVKPRELTKNALVQEVLRAQKFFKSKTSTVIGAREVRAVTERRLFGNSGAHFTSLEQEREYWAVYNEYKRLYADQYERLGSTQIQQLLADRLIVNGNDTFNLGDALSKARQSISEWEFEHL